MKKVTMQDIANILNISRVTVWKVLNNQSGVSKQLRDQILKTAKEIGYFKPGQEIEKHLEEYAASLEEGSKKTISVVISRPESSVFWINIIHAIAKELDTYGINLMYTYLPPNYNKGYILPNVLTNGTVGGMLILNVYNKELLEMLNKVNIPKVYLDIVSDFPTATLTGDLFLLEGKRSIKEITNDIIHKGRTEIGFIGDINYALTNKERFEGFLAAMNENHLEVKKEYCLTGNIGIYTYYEEISAFLNKLDKLPNAFVCASDFVANFLMQYFSEHGYRVPEDIALSGFDGSTEYAMVSGKLTTVNVQTNQLGRRLARQLLYRMEYPDAPLELTYVHSDIIWGKSTEF
ncbi:MAG: LacI family transcriptional regulator [Clostridiales bacterium]|nr:LacI family transcriptional regulator [Clostridiales bacterium]